MGTVAVIGTPLSHVYPKENAELQRKVASEYLIISQVPLRRYERQDYRKNRLFFPERNITVPGLGRTFLPPSLVDFFYGAVQPHLDQMQHAPINDPARYRL